MSLVVSRVANLTAQLGRMSLRQQPTKALWCSQTIRSFASKDDEDASQQHKEWVKFQQSISVDGFETGQTVTIASKKRRGGKAAARRRSRQDQVAEKLAERQRLTSFGGGLYPPLRYSDEETERLLAEAYAAIPERAGKRGTRNQKRQNVRWHLVRKIRKKYKKQLIRHHERKMEERSRRIQQVKEVLAEAPEIRKRDREYQAQVLRRWAVNMVQDRGEESTETETSDSLGTLKEGRGSE